MVDKKYYRIVGPASVLEIKGDVEYDGKADNTVFFVMKGKAEIELRYWHEDDTVAKVLIEEGNRVKIHGSGNVTWDINQAAVILEAKDYVYKVLIGVETLAILLFVPRASLQVVEGELDPDSIREIATVEPIVDRGE